MCLHVIGFRDEHDRAAIGPQVVEHAGRSIRGLRVRDNILEGRNRGLVEGRCRALCRGIVGPDGLDRVADELETNRLPGTCRVEINNAATHAELAVFVDRILPGIAGRGEQIPEPRWRHVLAGGERQRYGFELRRRTDPRQERRSGGDDQPGGLFGDGMKCSRAGRCDVEMRSQSSIRIDFVRREGEHGALDLQLGQPFERREKESRIARRRFDVSVCRNDEQHAIAVGRNRSKQGLGRRRQPRDSRRRRTKPKAAGGRLQKRAQCERTGGV